jgi:hypothetical protein
MSLKDFTTEELKKEIEIREVRPKLMPFDGYDTLPAEAEVEKFIVSLQENSTQLLPQIKRLMTTNFFKFLINGIYFMHDESDPSDWFEEKIKSLEKR